MNDAIHYPANFYRGRNARSRESAQRMLGALAEILPPITRITDYGCGVGTWLAVAGQIFDTTDLCGYEGPWVEPDMLEVAPHQFEVRDLSRAEERAPTRDSDLVLCLEVAEHLAPAHADDLVQCLTRRSAFVLFSAAIPHQGGKGHVNERWPGYWRQRFDACGFETFAPLRERFWNDEHISPWYRQNLLLCVARDRVAEVRLSPAERAASVLDIVHPAVFEAALARQQKQIDQLTTLRGAWHNFRRALAGRPYRVRPRRARDPRDPD